MYSTFPNSWFRVAKSEELSVKGVIPLHYFGKDFVLFRTEDGKPHILDAHCPHLGAHLAHGGRIEGQTLRCPYHGWLWDTNGHCAAIPYPGKATPKAKIQTWPVAEVNGLIMMYYHQQGKLPEWEIPQIPELISKEWTPLHLVHQWKVRATLQDYMDNSVDVSHLSNLHSRTFKSAQSHGVEIDGPILTHKMSQKYNLSSLAAGKLVLEDGSVTTIYYGPAYDVSFYWTEGKLKLGLLTIFTGTPIDGEYLDIQIFYSVKKVLPFPLSLILNKMLKQDVLETFEQDISILENKTNINNPPLYEEDGPVRQSRRWANQFYSENSVISGVPVQQ
ncbi:MAG: Rieske 2Fe-2S domain-containing protein [Microcoleaceae cyanobacterium]